MPPDEEPDHDPVAGARARFAAATPGARELRKYTDEMYRVLRPPSARDQGRGVASVDGKTQEGYLSRATPEDFAFYAHAHEDVAALLARITELEYRLDPRNDPLGGRDLAEACLAAGIEGMVAMLGGLPDDQNPYPLGHRCRDYWQDGYAHQSYIHALQVREAVSQHEVARLRQEVALYQDRVTDLSKRLAVMQEESHILMRTQRRA